MTLDEAIKHAEEVAEEQESRGYCDRSVCVIMDENNHNCDECEVVKCRECADEHRQLAEWLKELKAHREAWKKIFDEMMDVSIPGQDAEYVYQNIYDIIKKYRPSLAILANKSEAKE